MPMVVCSHWEEEIGSWNIGESLCLPLQAVNGDALGRGVNHFAPLLVKTLPMCASKVKA